MKATVIEHSSTDFRIVVNGKVIKTFTSRDRAVSYCRGWNQVKR